jgi:hypothetical protein
LAMRSRSSKRRGSASALRIKVRRALESRSRLAVDDGEFLGAIGVVPLTETFGCKHNPIASFRLGARKNSRSPHEKSWTISGDWEAALEASCFHTVLPFACHQ